MGYSYSDIHPFSAWGSQAGRVRSARIPTHTLHTHTHTHTHTPKDTQSPPVVSSLFCLLNVLTKCYHFYVYHDMNKLRLESTNLRQSR